MANVKDQVWHRALRRPYRLKKIIDLGTGERTIVLIHGIGAKAEIWKPFYEIIDKTKYRILAYDLLGFGESPRPDWLSYSVNEHVKSLAISLKKDAISKEIIVIGHSMGCIIATHLTTKKPKLVNKLVLYQPPLLMDSKLQVHKRFYEYIAGRPKLLVSYSQLAKKYPTKFSLPNIEQGHWLSFERSLKNTIIAQRTINELKTLPTETHIVYGRLDFVVSRLDAKKMALINPHIKLHYVTEKHDISQRSAKYLQKLLDKI